MRGDTGALASPESLPAFVPQIPLSWVAPVSFPLPGGRNLVVSEWIIPPTRRLLGSDSIAPPISTAARRRRVARRRSVRGASAPAPPALLPMNPADAAATVPPFGSTPRTAPEAPLP